MATKEFNYKDVHYLLYIYRQGYEQGRKDEKEHRKNKFIQELKKRWWDSW